MLCFLDGAFSDSTSSVYVAGASSASDRRVHIARRKSISNACFQARILSSLTRIHHLACPVCLDSFGEVLKVKLRKYPSIYRYSLSVRHDNMATYSLFCVFNFSFLPNCRVRYYDYVK